MRILPLLLMICVIWPHTSNAQETPCDPEYFKSMKSRAWLEAQREITQNQNLIFKPDSVFEYTCFDKHLNELADHAKDMFSETGRWGVIPGIHSGTPGTPVSADPTSMDKALDSLVGEALRNYIDQNFDKTGEAEKTYPLLGGRFRDKQDSNGNTVRESYDYEIKSNVIGTNALYDCETMNKVWMAAKCMDFIDNETHDGFFTFEEYRDYDGDHRFLPKECAHLDAWMQEIDRAYANEAQTPWEEDNIVSFYNLLESGNCSASPLILTGLEVSDGGKIFADGVCLKPGCYNNGNGTCTGE